VNVKINYNQTLDFPAVTICNQNAFRYILFQQDLNLDDICPNYKLIYLL
jgi:hypothetical protein